ncbi:hypothetical protein SUGI_0819480 [Cryptomeria japonica]|uniref:uncharacterized protein LOC131077687 n=1 Tax=Cryptomeria japonica TaxID=3369 RepID=UPI0024147C55|nr:uncharacterized protein LOC131077687 [Cryptomeria japonica]XP_057871208.1 uncharacterized protein LOC131077690 [Cryptomeria japonica]GLJ40034.1 hypothetical protein SUGI_0819480 [Cryptomeria japonica]
MGRWMKPEVYPLVAATSVAVTMCVFQLVRNLVTNPDVRISKENRHTEVPKNWEEGKRYAENGMRKFVRKRAPEVMPSMTSLFHSTSK